jgi:hypothetical protein
MIVPHRRNLTTACARAPTRRLSCILRDAGRRVMPYLSRVWLNSNILGLLLFKYRQIDGIICSSCLDKFMVR